MSEEITRGKNEKCLICSKKFNLFNPEHICKRCLRSVCKDCAQTKTNVYKKDGTKNQHRLCLKCLPEHDFLGNYKNKYLSVFGVNTPIGNQWWKEIKKFSCTINQLKTKKDPLKITKKDFWQSLNFSLRNMFGLCTQGIQYYQTMKNLYEKINNKICSEYACLFFLCHCSQSYAFDILNMSYAYLSQNSISPQKIYKNFRYLGCTNSQITKLKPFTQYILPKFISNLTLNIATAQISIFLISDFIRQKSIKSLQKGLSAILFTIKDFIIRYFDARKTIETEIVLNVRFSQFEQNMKILAQKQVLEEESVQSRNYSEVFQSSSVNSIQLRDSFVNQRSESQITSPTLITNPAVNSDSVRQSQINISHFQKSKIESPYDLIKQSTPEKNQSKNTILIQAKTQSHQTKHEKNVDNEKHVLQKLELRTKISEALSEKKSEKLIKQIEPNNDQDSFEEEINGFLAKNKQLIENNRNLMRLGQLLLKEIQMADR